MGFWSNITTGKDNQTHDIVRVAMTLVTFLLPLILMWGVGLETWAVLKEKPFDMNSFFLAIGGFLTLFSGFLTGAAASILLKKTTEPDGTQTTVESIKEGKTENVTRVTETNIIEPGAIQSSGENLLP